MSPVELEKNCVALSNLRDKGLGLIMFLDRTTCDSLVMILVVETSGAILIALSS